MIDYKQYKSNSWFRVYFEDGCISTHITYHINWATGYSEAECVDSDSWDVIWTFNYKAL